MEYPNAVHGFWSMAMRLKYCLFLEVRDFMQKQMAKWGTSTFAWHACSCTSVARPPPKWPWGGWNQPCSIFFLIFYTFIIFFLLWVTRHNLIGVDVAFNGFCQNSRRKLGGYLLFLHTTWSSQNIFIPHGAYCKSV